MPLAAEDDISKERTARVKMSWSCELVQHVKHTTVRTAASYSPVASGDRDSEAGKQSLPEQVRRVKARESVLSSIILHSSPFVCIH